MALEPFPIKYSDYDACVSLFSEIGVLLRLDDDDDGVVHDESREEFFLADAIQEATDTCNEYLLHIYDAEELEKSRIVRRWCTWIACFFLSRRRGNPGQFVDEYEQAILKMTAVMEHRAFIPRIKPRDNFEPGHSNLIVDDRYWRRKLRVSVETSSGGTSDRQHQDYGWGLGLYQ